MYFNDQGRFVCRVPMTTERISEKWWRLNLKYLLNFVVIEGNHLENSKMEELNLKLCRDQTNLFCFKFNNLKDSFPTVMTN